MIAIIDLNADLGEGVTDDGALLESVTSANVACGFHAGDNDTMARVCEGAAARGVVVGAQVSYDDREGFGRRAMDLPFGVLAHQVAEQIATLERHARAAGIRVAYLKPHGALYNRAVRDAEQAAAVVAGLAASGVGALPVLGLPGSALHAAATAGGVPTVTEAFADRAYTSAGTLVPRSERGAVIDAPAVVVARAVAIATGQPIADISGAPLGIAARSLCVHGDTPGAAALAAKVRAALAAADVEVRAFA